ncbi:MAG: glycosyltransferase [Verrucomicrobiales bacterium]
MPTVASYCTTFLKAEMRHIYRQVTGLQRYRTFVICKERQCEERYPFGDVLVAPKARSNFVRRFWLKYIKREPPIVYRGEYGVLARLLAAREADLMHVYFGHTGVHLLSFLRRWPKPALVSFHGMDIQTRDDRAGYAENLRSLLETVPMVLARSESLKGRLIELGCAPGKIRLNRTGIPMSEFPFVERCRPADGGWRFVQACRLVEKKGIDVALRAFARFAAHYPKALFSIAGDGPLEKPLETLAAELGLADKVRFTGFLNQADLRNLYHQSHLFVHPSHLTADQNQEGIPNSMIEAMATGLPVLATRHGGIPEAVRAEFTGLLGRERDEDGLLENMERLASEPGLWERLGRQAARDVRENFEQSSQIARLEDCYDELLEMGMGNRK